MRPNRQTKTNQFQPLEAYRTELFATPFWKLRFNYNLDEIVRDVRKAVSVVEKQSGGDTKRNYTTYFDRDIHDEYIGGTQWCKQLTTNLKDTYVDIMHKEFLKDPREQNMLRSNIHCCLWVNRYTDQHEHSVHNHKGTILSGTFYVKTSQPCAPIIFESPNEYANMLFMTEDRHHQGDNGQDNHFGVPAVQKEFQFQPRDGDIALWPSYLYHHVPSQHHQEERISISFNLAHSVMYGPSTTDKLLDECDYSFLTQEECQ